MLSPPPPTSEPEELVARTSNHATGDDKYDTPYGRRLVKLYADFVLSRPNRKLDDIYAQAVKPNGAFPPDVLMPSWLRWPLNQKLPQLNVKHGHYWSRGKLGKSLVLGKGSAIQQSCRPDFILVDPTHIKPPYDPLHDPCLENHFKKPCIKSVLKRNHLIDDKGFVTCSQKEQNEYRAYLHSTSLRNEADEYYKMQIDNHIHLYKEHEAALTMARNWPQKHQKWEETIHNGKNITDSKKAITQQKYNAYQNRFEKVVFVKRLSERIQNTGQQRGDMKTKTIVSDMMIYKSVPRSNLQLRMKWAEDAKLALLEDRKGQKDANRKSRWEAMLTRMVTKADNLQCSTEFTRMDRKRRILKREAKFMEHRRLIPIRIKEKKLEEERLATIALKFGKIWLMKIREKLIFEKIDVEHFSAFDVTRSLDVSVGDIYRDTGGRTDHALAGFDFKSFMKNVKKQQKQLKEQNKSHAYNEDV